MKTVPGKPKSSSTTAHRVVRGLKLSIGIIAATIAYAAVITPILVKIIRKNKAPKDDSIEVSWRDADVESDQ